MKHIMTLFLVVVALNQSFAQGILSEGKIWSQVNYELPSFTAITVHLKIEGDTLIDNLAYKKVFCSTTAEQTDWKKYLSIRETTDGSIYFRTDTSKQEYLFFNPNCTILDTLNLYTITSFDHKKTIRPYKLRVEGKDSILLNGKYVKRVLLSDTFEPKMISDYYLEGIGSTAGLVYWDGMLVGGDNYNLICCNENGTLIFHDEKFPSCYYSWNWNSIEEFSSPPLVEVETLSKGVLRVTTKSAPKGKLTIYNTLGKQIISKLVNQPITTLCLPQNGIYLYRFTTHNGKVQTGKVAAR